MLLPRAAGNGVGERSARSHVYGCKLPTGLPLKLFADHVTGTPIPDLAPVTDSRKRLEIPSRSKGGDLLPQVDKTPVQVENIHNVLAAGAPRFTPRHLDRLFQLIQQSWENASDRYRERLLHLIGKIGRDDRTGKTANKVRGPTDSHNSLALP